MTCDKSDALEQLHIEAIVLHGRISSLWYANMDPLQPFLDHFSPTARHLFSGDICGLSPTHYAGNVAYLHFFRGGKLTILPEGAEPFTLVEPSVILFATPWNHHMHGDEVTLAKMLCVTIEYGSQHQSPILLSLPRIIIVPLREAPNLGHCIAMLEEEADAKRMGWKTATNHLFEYLMAQIVRFAIEKHDVKTGVLAGFGDEKLRRSLEAIHQRLAEPWTLEALAELAGMSRARFAERFKEVVGATPMEYLLECRLNLARTLLRRGQAVKAIAASTGFAGTSTFVRAFRRSMGMSPLEWFEYVSAKQN